MIEKKEREVNEKVLDLRRWQPCIACYQGPPCDPAHVVSVGAGGPDTEWNVVSLCRKCHSLQHSLGIRTFMKMQAEFRFNLRELGWTWDTWKLYHPKLKR